MDLSLVETFLLAHLVVSILYTFLIIKKISSLPLSMILIIVCIPLFGLLSALAADLVKKYDLKPKSESEEVLNLDEDIYWKTIKSREEAQNIVPLEEALIINDRSIRKKLVFEMLLDDPLKNIDILLLARENNDVDTAHYANTTIAKIQRDFQLKIQKLAVEYEKDQDDIVLLDTYIATLGKFIESGLSEAFLQKKQRVTFGKLLDARLAFDGTNQDILHKKIKNSIELKEIQRAIESVEILTQNFPDDEKTWMGALQVSVASHDSKRLDQTISIIQKKQIDWSPENKEIVKTWVQV